MPEGPEVKRCADLLGGILAGETVTDVKLVSGKLRREGVPGLDKLQLPARVEEVFAHGKIIFVKFKEHMLVSTLGMSGWWYPPPDQLREDERDRVVYYQGRPLQVGEVISRAHKHARVQLKTQSGKLAVYVDPRNFGNLTLMTHAEARHRISELGVDFLNDTHDLARRAELALKKFRGWAIGEVLLNQSALAGLGNIYRAETLYLAGIDPRKKIFYLTDFEIETLIKCAYAVLHIAYVNQGSMTYPFSLLRQTVGRTPGVIEKIDELVKRGEQVKQASFFGGEAQLLRHLVYGHKTDPFGHKIVTEAIGGRRFWWVPEIQT